MPIRTNVIDAGRAAMRGRSAERMPIGIAISSQRIAPPITSDAVTGAAWSTSVFTLCRLKNE